MAKQNRGRTVRFCLALNAGLILAALGFAATPGLRLEPAGAPGAVPQDTRVVVNIPAYRMDLFQDGKLVKSYRIGIGYPEFPLPIGVRTADEIIISPTWTPPNEAWVDSPRSKVKAGRKVAAGSKLNPLGPIKIPIGLPSLIHGGKMPGAIGGFASHGCVGLTDAEVLDFAMRLAHAGGTGISDQQMQEDLKNKRETKAIKLNKPVPVELRYEPIVVQDGRLHIYRDVYAQGTDTPDNAAAVLQAYGVAPDQLTPEQRRQVITALGKMERDANGNPVTRTAEVASTPKKGTTPHVTRIIKGQKEVVIDIPALKGKGYPDPVGFDVQGSQRKLPAGRRTRR